MTPLEITNPRQTNASLVVGSVTEVHQLKYHLSLCTASEDSTVFYRLYSTFEVSSEVQRGIDSATGKGRRVNSGTFLRAKLLYRCVAFDKIRAKLGATLLERHPRL